MFVMGQLTPYIGVRVTGLDLASLDKAGQDQLALLCAKKGIVFFGSDEKVKQTFRDVSLKKKLDMVRYYGQLHQHAVQPRPPESTEISVVYQDNMNTVRVSRYQKPECLSKRDSAYKE